MLEPIANRKRVLVAGGAGFLGSHLCERLLADGCDVLCVDNFYCGTKENIAHFKDHPHFEVMRHDVTFPLYVEVDEIYNLACPARRSTTSGIQSRRLRPACSAQICWPGKATKAKIFQASLAKSMVIP